MSILLIATVLSTQIPTKTVEDTWGQHMRARHFQGSWSVEVSGKRLSGDWITIDLQPRRHTRVYSGRMIHLSGSDGAYCAIPLDRSSSMYCEAPDLHNLRLPAPADATAILAGAALASYECHGAACDYYPAGALAVKVRAVRPTLAQGRELYQRITTRTIEQDLGARWAGTTLRMPYKLYEDRGVRQGAARGEATTGYEGLGGVTAAGEPPITQWSSQEIIEAEATIVLTADPAPKITARETGRYIEECDASYQIGQPGCMPQPRKCARIPVTR